MNDPPCEVCADANDNRVCNRIVGGRGAKGCWPCRVAKGKCSLVTDQLTSAVSDLGEALGSIRTSVQGLADAELRNANFQDSLLKALGRIAEVQEKRLKWEQNKMLVGSVYSASDEEKEDGEAEKVAVAGEAPEQGADNIEQTQK